MTTPTHTAPPPAPVIARPALPPDKPALERLWLLFRHDMSAVSGELPRADGTYRTERLRHALDGDPGWRAWILTAGEHPVGLGIVRALDQPVRVLTSFFVVAPARRTGLGTAFARSILSAAPGRWEIAYQDLNQQAARFWPVVAGQIDPDWTHERRTTPARPDLPADSWISLTVPAAPHDQAVGSSNDIGVVLTPHHSPEIGIGKTTS